MTIEEQEVCIRSAVVCFFLQDEDEKEIESSGVTDAEATKLPLSKLRWAERAASFTRVVAE